MARLPFRASARRARRFGVPALIAVPAALALAAPAQAETVRLTALGCGGEAGVTANEWTVPAGVHRITLTAHGAQGGGNGGFGAVVTSDLSVAPGGVLYACVDVGGGKGGAGFGGVNGGDGGGYASVSIWPDGSDPLMIAAGGGGRGAQIGGSVGGLGGDAGTPGQNAGGGGTAANSGGGTGATENGAGEAGPNFVDAYADGYPGAIRRGGAGGEGFEDGVGGGGGGGGVYGGGGGAGSEWTVDGGAAGGGGGGGNSYCGLSSCRSDIAPGPAYVEVSWPDAPKATTTSVVSNPERAKRSSTVKYVATVSPVPAGGTVEFRLGGGVVPGCEATPVNTTTGVAECETIAPWELGPHTIGAAYSGTTGFATSSNTGSLTVTAPQAVVSPRPVEFGSVVLGETVTRTVTIANEGAAPLEIYEDHGIWIAGYMPVGEVTAMDMPVNDTDFDVASDRCSATIVPVGGSCEVTISFKPSELGDRTARLYVQSDSADSVKSVPLNGVGIEAPVTPQPEEPKPEQPQPEQPKPETPAPPAQPQAPQAQSPAPTPPSAPAPAPKPEPAPAPVVRGAVLAPAARRAGVSVAETGAVKLPVRCPAGQACRIGGTLTLAVTTTGRQASAAATKTRVLVRFKDLRVAANKTRTLSLRLPKAFVKAQQAKGVRKLRTTLTIRTTLGSGRRVVTRQSVTLLIPKAKPAQVRPEPTQRPSFTG